MPGHFTKQEKKKNPLLDLENVAVKFQWWVYKFVLVTVTVKSEFSKFFSALGVEFLFQKKMYRNLYLGIKRGLLHHVEKVCRKKCLILLLLCRKKIPFLPCTYFSLPTSLWNGYLGWFIRCRHLLYFYWSL